MIRPLRVVHRRVFLVYAFALPVLVIAALRARQWQPDPPVVRTADPAGPLSVRVDGGQLRIAVQSGVAAPDLLAYWSTEEPLGTLPSDASLLGPLAPSIPAVFPKPAQQGYVVIYSLGHKRVVGRAAFGGAQ